MLTIDNFKCLCTKNKKSNLQCPNKRKDGSLFCGVHIRSKIKNRVDDLLKNGVKPTFIKYSTLPGSTFCSG